MEEEERKRRCHEEVNVEFACVSRLGSSYNTGSSSIGSSVDLLVSELSGTELG